MDTIPGTQRMKLLDYAVNTVTRLVGPIGCSVAAEPLNGTTNFEPDLWLSEDEPGGQLADSSAGLYHGVTSVDRRQLR